MKKLSERVKTVDEILEEAKKILKDNVNSAMSFSDRVNLLEKLAHQIYLDSD